MLTALRGSKNIHYSEFFPMGDMSLPNLFVYSSIHLYWYGLTDIYFIFGLYFVTQLVTALAPGSSFIWLLCPFNIPIIVIVSFLPSFLPSILPSSLPPFLSSFLRASLLSGATGFSRVILYVPCPSTRVSILQGVLVPFIGGWY